MDQDLPDRRPQDIETEVMRHMVALNAIVDDQTLEQHLAQYAEVASWPKGQMYLNLLAEGMMLVEPDTLERLATGEDARCTGSFLGNAAAHGVLGVLKESGKRYLIEFEYEDGRFVLDESSAVVEESDGLAQRMSSEERVAIGPVTDRLLEGATLLLHESVKRQMREFEDVRKLVASPIDPTDATQAQAKIVRLERPQRGLAVADNGTQLDLMFHLKDGSYQGVMTLPDGERSRFQILEMGILGTRETAFQVAIEGQEGEPYVAETLDLYFAPRLGDYKAAKGVLQRAAAAKALSAADHPMHVLEAELCAEERRMATWTEHARQTRMELDGLQVRAHLTDGR